MSVLPVAVRCKQMESQWASRKHSRLKVWSVVFLRNAGTRWRMGELPGGSSLLPENESQWASKYK